MLSKEQILPEYKRKTPKIYAYSDTSFPGQIKVGYTERDDVMERIREQYPVNRPQDTFTLLWFDVALYEDGSSFTDKDLHRYLKKHGVTNTNGEWFKCTLQQVKNAYIAVKNKKEIETTRFLDFGMRDEQRDAVDKTINYFNKVKSENPSFIPHFLWNAKMRFGKTFTTYQLAKRMNAKKVLILTFKPAVEESWHDDLMYHKDFEGWQFFSARSGESPDVLDETKPIVCFGSFQDFLGKNSAGGIKSKNEWVHATNWDLIVLDEYHYGAWNDNAKSLVDSGDQQAKEEINEQNTILAEDGFDVASGKLFDEESMPITGYHYLYLSGTPFKALSSGEFLEDQIFNWTYQDEQEAKASYEGDNNPYEELPTMVLMTYQMPDSLGYLVDQYDMNEFDLNEFFKAEGEGENAKFVHENAVQKWLDIIRGKASIFNNESPLNKMPALPYDDSRLLDICNHTMWFLYSVSSCDAMYNLFMKPCNNFYQNYNIVNCSGKNSGNGLDALGPVRKAMTDNPILSKTIILTCGKLTTGVTIKPLSGIFMLRNCASPETYFQSAFRVQSPWSIIDESAPNKKHILKKTCYVFDFAPNRALREVVDYANKLEIKSQKNATQKVSEFINFLPILQFDGSSMKEVNAVEILDFVDNGTTASLLARRWNSATLVNVDNLTLQRVLNDPKAMKAIMKIEGFRALGKDIIESIVNKSKKIRDLKKKGDKLTPKEKTELSKEEKEYKSKRREVQEKLIKFATRIPIFMYLTDYREEALTDIIRKLEPNLFARVTGLEIEDFELLVSLGVFNDSQMNDAILKFRRYEDSSLTYTGLDKHKSDTRIGAWDTSISKEDFIIQKK